MKNTYSEYTPVKQAFEKLSDISPQDSNRWLKQFKELKKMIEYYARKTTLKKSKYANIDNYHNRGFV